jgi:hypothetical protein
MTDWLDKEKTRQDREQIAQQLAKEQKVSFERDVVAYLASNTTINTFVESVSDYLHVALKAPNRKGESVKGEDKYDIEKAMITAVIRVRRRSGYPDSVVRSLELTFSYERKGYLAEVFAGPAQFRPQRYTDDGTVMKKDSEGNFRPMTEVRRSGPASHWDLESGDRRKFFIPVSELNSDLAKALVTWLVGKSDAITITGQVVKTGFGETANVSEGLSNTLAGFAPIGVLVGFVIGFYNGFTFRTMSIDWSVFLLTSITCAVIWVVIVISIHVVSRSVSR